MQSLSSSKMKLEEITDIQENKEILNIYSAKSLLKK